MHTHKPTRQEIKELPSTRGTKILSAIVHYPDSPSIFGYLVTR